MGVATTLNLTIYPEQLPAFYPLFQEGVPVRVLTGCSVATLLVQQFGIAPDYLRTRISTLFLNGRAVDDAEKAIVGDGAVLALSGAMPGLVGATLRSGGYYAAMRSSISYHSPVERDPLREGTIRIKLFNLLLGELGPVLLHQGVLLPGERLAPFFAAQEETFWRECRKILLNGVPLEDGALRSGKDLSDRGTILLTVGFRGRL